MGKELYFIYDLQFAVRKKQKSDGAGSSLSIKVLEEGNSKYINHMRAI